jgi:hypothetical protein
MSARDESVTDMRLEHADALELTARTGRPVEQEPRSRSLAVAGRRAVRRRAGRAAHRAHLPLDAAVLANTRLTVAGANRIAGLPATVVATLSPSR